MSDRFGLVGVQLRDSPRSERIPQPAIEHLGERHVTGRYRRQAPQRGDSPIRRVCQFGPTAWRQPLQCICQGAVPPGPYNQSGAVFATVTLHHAAASYQPGDGRSRGESVTEIARNGTTPDELGLQIKERDWHPSTGTLAPLIQLARDEARKATTPPTSSARPNRPNGSSRRTNSAMPLGSSCWRRYHVPPGKEIDPGATLFTRMLSFASCCAIDLARLISAAFTTL